MEIVEKEPQDLGYKFGRWTGKRLSEHLEKVTGIKLSKSQISRILSREKYVYIWGKYSLEDKQDKKKREEFKEKLAEYLKLAQEKPESIQVWFGDECGFSLRVIRRRCWTKKGKRKKVKGHWSQVKEIRKKSRKINNRAKLRENRQLKDFISL